MEGNGKGKRMMKKRLRSKEENDNYEEKEFWGWKPGKEPGKCWMEESGKRKDRGVWGV